VSELTESTKLKQLDIPLTVTPHPEKTVAPSPKTVAPPPEKLCEEQDSREHIIDPSFDSKDCYRPLPMQIHTEPCPVPNISEMIAVPFHSSTLMSPPQEHVESCSREYSYPLGCSLSPSASSSIKISSTDPLSITGLDNFTNVRSSECLRRYCFDGEGSSELELDTLVVSQLIRDTLALHNIGQRCFARYVLGLSQGTVSELLSSPKSWNRLTEKGRDSYRKMIRWASDASKIAELAALSTCGGKSKYEVL